MTRPMILLGAIVLLSTLAGPAAAQHVSSSPGRCAQFYPNANCQNYGPATPTSATVGGVRTIHTVTGDTVVTTGLIALTANRWDKPI